MGYFEGSYTCTKNERHLLDHIQMVYVTSDPKKLTWDFQIERISNGWICSSQYFSDIEKVINWIRSQK